MATPSHRSEQTGNPGMDRIQGNVRDLIAEVRQFIAELTRAHGIGVRRIIMKDAPYRLTSKDLTASVLIIDGPLTAQRDVIVPRATDLTAYQRWFDNVTGQDLRIINEDGSQLLTSLAGVSFIVVSSEGPVGYT